MPHHDIMISKSICLISGYRYNIDYYCPALIRLLICHTNMKFKNVKRKVYASFPAKLFSILVVLTCWLVVFFTLLRHVTCPTGIFKSTCYIDVRWFPFDVQRCDLKFGSWTYGGWSLDLQMMDADTTGYTANGEWDLVGMWPTWLVGVWCCGSHIQFNIRGGGGIETMSLHAEDEEAYEGLLIHSNLIPLCLMLVNSFMN